MRAHRAFTPVTLKRNNYITKLSDHALDSGGTSHHVCARLESGQMCACLRVALRQPEASSEDAVFCVWCYISLATPLLVPASTRASQHGSEQHCCNRHIPVPHVCWPEKAERVAGI